LRRRVSTLEKKSKPKPKKIIESCWRVIEFLAQMPTDTKIFLTMAILGLATMLIVVRLI